MSKTTNKPKRVTNNNPNKVNQYTAPDPRQALYLKKYLDPKSDTFSNSYKSALAVGYSNEYSLSLIKELPAWLSKNLQKSNFLNKAEKNLDDVLDLETQEPVVTMAGILKDKDGQVVTKQNSNLLRTKVDVSKFVAERIGKAIWDNREVIVPTKQVFLTFVNKPQFITAVKGFEDSIKEMIQDDKEIEETPQVVDVN